MSVFRFITESILDLHIKNLSDVRLVSFLLRAPVDVQKVLLNFGSNNVIEIIKKNRIKRGLEDPVIRWMNENPVTIEDDYDVEGWPLYFAFKEQKGSLTIKRNPQLEKFYINVKELTGDVKDLLVTIEHKNSSLLYSYWLLLGCPVEFEMVLPEIQQLFSVSKANYYSYSLVESKIFKRVEKVLLCEKIKFTHRKDPPPKATGERVYAKKIVIQIKPLF